MWLPRRSSDDVAWLQNSQITHVSSGLHLSISEYELINYLRRLECGLNERAISIAIEAIQEDKNCVFEARNSTNNITLVGFGYCAFLVLYNPFPKRKTKEHCKD